MSQDGIIAIASLISVFIVTSLGCLCGLNYREQTQNPPSTVNQPASVYYEDVLYLKIANKNLNYAQMLFMFQSPRKDMFTLCVYNIPK